MKCLHVHPRKGQCRRGLHDSGLHVYATLKQIGRRKKRTLTAERVFKRDLVERSDGWCEATSLILGAEPSFVQHDLAREVCGTSILHEGHDPHHVEPNDRRKNVHDADRGLLLCRRAHDYTHTHPHQAKLLGLLRPKAST